VALLDVRGVEAGYGEVQVLWGVDLTVAEGEIVALVGSNGAGKTTLLRCLSGLLRASRGTIHFHGQATVGLGTEALVRRGLLLVPEGRRLFAGMSVRDNLLMGAYLQPDREAIRGDLERVYGLFPVLHDRQGQLAGTLSGGEQQMCALARGLMARPRLLLIDEMSLGLAPVALERLVPAIREIHRQGISILLVEQDAQTALEMAGRAYVLEHGAVALRGTGAELLANEHVRRAYLGL
jgi:branched-chain amino acid transport system ATP-binding protein